MQPATDNIAPQAPEKEKGYSPPPAANNNAIGQAPAHENDNRFQTALKSSTTLSPTPKSSKYSEKNPLYHLRPGQNVSEGGKLFDLSVYWGMGFGLNAALGLKCGDYFLHGGGAKWFENKVDLLASTKVINKTAPVFGMKPGNMAVRIAGLGTLMLGGWGALVPMGIAEYFKKPIIKSLDKNVFGKDAEHDAKLQQYYAELEREPKSSIFQLIGSRIAGMFAVWTTMATIGSHDSGIPKWLNESNASPLKGQKILGIDNLADKFGKHMDQAMPNYTPNQPISNIDKNTRRASFYNNLAQEATYTMLLAGVVEVCSKSFRWVFGGNATSLPVAPATPAASLQAVAQSDKAVVVKPAPQPAMTAVHAPRERKQDAPETRIAASSTHHVAHEPVGQLSYGLQ